VYELFQPPSRASTPRAAYRAPGRPQAASTTCRNTTGKLNSLATSAFARSNPRSRSWAAITSPAEALAEAASTGHRFGCIKLSYSHSCERRAVSKRKGRTGQAVPTNKRHLRTRHKL
jgi:hypothetical protein